MASPADCKYTKDHEWVRLDGESAVVGITDYAQQELGDVVFVELPSPGATVQQGESFGVVESVKAASDLFAPLSGEVLATNDALTDNPDLVNKVPFGDGWMLRLKPTDPAQLDALMDAATYDSYVQGLH
jgi:glycine cleavage system H protein